MGLPIKDGMKTTKDVLTELFLRYAYRSREEFFYLSELMILGVTWKPTGIDENKLKTVVIDFGYEEDNVCEIADTDLVHCEVEGEPADYVHKLVEEGWHVACVYNQSDDPEDEPFVLVIKFYHE